MINTETFALAVITKEKLCQVIQAAQKRIVFAAPGIDESVAHALVQSYEKLSPDSIYIHIDPSERALLTGYGTTRGVEILASLGKAHIAETWRLGLLIADDQAFIYAPTAQAKEPPPQKGDEPNGVILRGIVVDYFADSIRGPAHRPLLSTKNTQDSEAQEIPETKLSGSENPPTPPAPKIPDPRDARLMDMVRRTFKIVEFHHSLTLADKRIQLTAKDFGIRTEEVDPQLSISFRIIGDEDRKTINKIMNGFDREIEKWAKGGILRTPRPRLQIVWYDDPQYFQSEFAKVKSAVETKIREWFVKNYAQVQKKSEDIVTKFLNDDLFERVQPPREPRHRNLSDSEFRKQWVISQAKRYQLPSAEDVLKSLKVSYELYDISTEMIADPEFRKALEKEFDINLEEMLDQEERRNSNKEQR